MLKIKNLNVSTENNISILKNLSLNVNKGEVHAIMGPNGSGKSTLASVVAGDPKYIIKKGSINFLNKNLIDLEPDERAALGLFLSFQYPVEIPGISLNNFIKTALNQKQKALKLEPLSARQILEKIKKNAEILKIDLEFIKRSVNVGFSGGEKKRAEIFQMLMLEPCLSILDETDSGLDIDALKIVAKGVNSLRNKNSSFIIITHYQRLLDYIKPDFVHVLSGGKIIKSGGAEVAKMLEEKGYDWI
jgi:Fe-S cluster assembly ATP-binding protein